MIREWLERARRPLTAKAEDRIGKPVRAAVVFTVTHQPPRAFKGVLAITDSDVYLLDYREALLGTQVEGVREHYPRAGLLTRWDRRRLRVTAQLSWPDSRYKGYIAGWTRPGREADKLFGLLTASEFEHVAREDA